MDTAIYIIIAIVLACIGSTGFCSLIQFFITRNSGTKKDIQELKIATSRSQLTQLIKIDPKNENTILKEAEYYFIELKGDGYMANMFSRWAEANKVDISWFKSRVKDIN